LMRPDTIRAVVTGTKPEEPPGIWRGG